MNLKKIGISLRVEKIEKFNEKRDAISHDWVKFFERLEKGNLFNKVNNNKSKDKNIITNVNKLS